MKIYLKSGIKIKITEGIANDLWTALGETEDAKETYFRIGNVNTGDTLIIVPIDQISCVK